jgi:hypothetical protein
MDTDHHGDLLILSRDSDPRQPFHALRASDLRRELDNTKARQVVLILDGSYSGSFHASSSFDQHLSSRNTTVITSASPRESAVDGAFGRALVDGLRLGAADVDGDGDIKLLEAYEYARQSLGALGQSPTLAMYGGGPASVVIAQSVREEPRNPTSLGITDLPPDIKGALTSSSPRERERAAWMLCGLMCTDDRHELAQAVLGLFELTGDGDARVSGIARARLNGDEEFYARLATPLTWNDAITYIRHMEVNMARSDGDINLVTGRLRDSQVGGRGNMLLHSETAVSQPIDTLDDARNAISALAEDVSRADLDWRDKAEVLASFRWWQENVGQDEEPEPAKANASLIWRTGGWVWERFSSLMLAMPDAIVAAWVLEVIRNAAS